MFSHVTSLSSAISNTRQLAEYSRRVLPNAGIKAPLPAHDVTLHFRGEIVGSDRRPQFLVCKERRSAIFQLSLILNTIYRLCVQRAPYKKLNLIWRTLHILYIILSQITLLAAQEDEVCNDN